MHPRPAVNPRLLALLGVVAVAALLPLAGASAGPALREDAEAPGRSAPDGDAKASGQSVPDGDAKASGQSVPDEDAKASGQSAPGEDDRAPDRPAPADAPPADVPSVAAPSADAQPPAETTARCGPEVSSPKGVDAQTCVLTQAGETWARTYYRNATGEPMKAVLSLMSPTGRTVQMHCPVGAEDEPTACDTPRERTAGPAARYSAVAEFAAERGDALLLRSGSNSTAAPGS
ncbi:hypothetical protein GPA10_32435 [Streptomyces sp. p1417]|uniref:Serine/threonine protein kinase n=1 Tax=Streptomyces typhae TaxID=2681492 RepID=A0A6L6X6H9_9ACTN|nr:hypothetical protein [Streptomyces typhae]MVO89337.1 hypothetical protein [Streptomyces typhae]